MAMQTPFSILFGKSFMKIRSAVPQNGCLVFLWRTEKNRKKTNNICKTYTHPPHRQLRKKAVKQCRNLQNIITSSVFMPFMNFDNSEDFPSMKRLTAVFSILWSEQMSINRNHNSQVTNIRADFYLHCFTLRSEFTQSCKFDKKVTNCN